MHNPSDSDEFLEALLDAEIDPDDVLEIIDMWVNELRSRAIEALNS